MAPAVLGVCSGACVYCDGDMLKLIGSVDLNDWAGTYVLCDEFDFYQLFMGLL
jgi:hypothetical protein